VTKGIRAIWATLAQQVVKVLKAMVATLVLLDHKAIWATLAQQVQLVPRVIWVQQDHKAI
jgi:hypothetical protein